MAIGGVGGSNFINTLSNLGGADSVSRLDSPLMRLLQTEKPENPDTFSDLSMPTGVGEEADLPSAIPDPVAALAPRLDLSSGAGGVGREARPDFWAAGAGGATPDLPTGGGAAGLDAPTGGGAAGLDAPTGGGAGLDAPTGGAGGLGGLLGGAAGGAAAPAAGGANLVDKAKAQNNQYLDAQQKSQQALQEASQKQSEAASVITNISKMLHDTIMQIFQNLK